MNRLNSALAFAAVLMAAVPAAYLGCTGRPVVNPATETETDDDGSVPLPDVFVNHWAQQIVGKAEVWGIAVDKGGNIFVTGAFLETASFGSITLTSEGFYDLFIAKLSPDGEFLWVTSAGGEGTSDQGHAIALDDSGQIYVMGSFAGDATFGDTTLKGKGSRDIFIAKLSPDGEFLWATSAGGSGDDPGYGELGVDNMGNVYVLGMFFGKGTAGSFTLDTNWLDGAILAKLSPDGEFLWAITLGNGPGRSSAHGMAVDGQGNAYVAGHIQGKVDFGSTRLTAQSGNYMLVAKVSAEGEFIWATCAGADGYTNAYGIGIVLDAKGDLYVTGSFDGTATFGDTTLVSNGEQDIFVTKLSAGGEFLKTISAGGAEADRGENIAVDGLGHIYLSGGFKDSMSLGSTSLVAKGNSDIFISKLSADWQFLWAISAGGATGDVAIDMALDESGTVYMTGFFHGIADFGGAGLKAATDWTAGYIWKLTPP